MATTTTNFGWDIPQSTDLVKDGATAIAALGQDIDTAFVDFKGGTTGQVLKKTSGTDLDVEWGTASQGLTLINTTSFSAVSSVSAPTGTFSALYRNYKVILDFTTASPTPNIQLRFRVGGVDNSTASSYNMQPLYGSGSSVVTANEVGAQAIIGNASSSTSLSTITMEIFAPFIANTTNFVSFPMQSGGNLAMIRTGFHNQSTSYDSISIIPTSSTITGQMYIYGYNI
jgi:hypothetical protein